MFKRYPLISRTLVFFIAPVIILVVYLYDTLFVQVLPPHSGEFIVPSITNNVTIKRDENGATYVNASSQSDLYFAMGFVHAQDRLWQMELQRRFAQGRLAEIFGKNAVQSDAWIRTLGIYSKAKEAQQYLSAEAHASLEAYARGVNAWLESQSRLPIEFTVLGFEPEPWSPQDSLAWAKMFALDLAGNMGVELQRFMARQHLSATQFTSLFPCVETTGYSQASDYDEKDDVGNVAQVSQLLELQAELESRFQLGGRYVGSNAWVVSGNLTESGSPILANDPHLGLQIPSLWYAVHQQMPSYQVSGMSLVGLPIVIFGKNEHIGWGGTNMMADVQDLFLEQVNPANPNQYLSDGEWETFTSHIETIQVKADFPASLRKPLAPLEIEVRHTRNGPIISDVNKSAGLPISLRWTALQIEDTSYESLYRLNYASNWSEFNEALSLFVAPTLNILYADNLNNIGFVGVGKVPVRSNGRGDLPRLGGQAKNQWQGFILFEDMPRQFNPDSGLLVSANNRNVDDHYPYFISMDWAPEARAQRISQLLQKHSSEGKLTLAQMGEIQADVTDLSVQTLVNTLLQIIPETTEQGDAIALLGAWDGRASMDSIGASIAYGWLRHLRKHLFEDELSTHWNHREQGDYMRILTTNIGAEKINAFLKTQSPWCDNVTTPATEDCQQVMLAALDDALKELRQYAGSDSDDWLWGEMQQTIYQHKPFSQVKVLDLMFERRIDNAGAENVVNVSAASFDKTEGYRQLFGAGFRQIFSLSSVSPEHWFMNSTGQSGHVASKHYDDMVEPFRNVEFVSLSSSIPHKDVLTLVPVK